MSFPYSPKNRSARRYLASVLAALIHVEDRDVVLSPDWQQLKQLNDIKLLHPLIQEVAQGSFRQKQPPAIQRSGWVVKSLEASLWAFHDADNFEEAVLKAANGRRRRHHRSDLRAVGWCVLGRTGHLRIAPIGSGTDGNAE